MKRLPLGISDYKKIIEDEYSYIDKTLFIEELFTIGTEVVLIPRPRRFGKTINLSMLRYFFEKTEKNHAYLFENFAIWQTEHKKLQGKFPVIFLSLKGIKKGNWEEAYKGLQTLIAEEYKKHRYLLKSLHEDEQKDFLSIIHQNKNEQNLFENSLRLLTQWLEKYHGARVVVLIDEYDTPIHDAYLFNYYDKMVSFMRNYLTEGLKDNSSLEKAVLTGILRISKESIFSGLNNPGCYTILDEEFSDKFGLLEEEVILLFQEHDLSFELSEVRKWYNGYKIGKHSLYNPWSILQCIQKKGTLKPYWVNTSDNALIKSLLIGGNDSLKQDLEKIISGGCITKSIQEGIIFSDLESQEEAIWGLFFFSGYLTLAAEPKYENLGLQCELKIPNQEIQDLYKSIIKYWFTKNLSSSNQQLLLKSLVTGNIEVFSEVFSLLVTNSMSSHDIPQNEPERVYHAFVLALLVALKKTHEIKSNRESGFGRYDVSLIPKDLSLPGVVLEFKKVSKGGSLEKTAEEALEQIIEKNYASELKNRGIKKILLLGIAFQGKKVYLKQHSLL